MLSCVMQHRLLSLASDINCTAKSEDGLTSLHTSGTSIISSPCLGLLRCLVTIVPVALGSAKNCFKICLNLWNGAHSKRCLPHNTLGCCSYEPAPGQAVRSLSSAAAAAFRPPTKRKAVGAFRCCRLSLLCWQRPRVLVYIGRSQHSSRMNLALGTPWRADSDDCTWKLQAGLLFNSPECSVFYYFKFYFL